MQGQAALSSAKMRGGEGKGRDHAEPISATEPYICLHRFEIEALIAKAGRPSIGLTAGSGWNLGKLHARIV